MADFDFDLFTIGAGSGGVAASRRAGAYGARVAICERGRVGGTCVLRGCVPKKLLVMGAHFAEELEDARGFGWTIEGARLDWGALIAAKDRELERLEGVYHRLLRDSGVALVEGRATLVDAHTVEVAGRRYTAQNILLAAGGHPKLPDIPGREHVLTSDEALSLAELPARLVIVGGGFIGCELAGVFHAAGSQVTMLVRGDELLRGFDDDVRSALGLAYRDKGIRVVPDVLVEDVERRADGTLSVLAREDTFEADAVLFAIGRAPSTQGLGLDRVGVEVDAAGAIVVDGQSRTSVPSIFAVGDVTNRLNLTPVAIAEGRILVEMLYRGGDGVMEHVNVPAAVFSQPPVATVGCSEAVARRRHGDIDVYATSFRPMKHTLSGRHERMMMKLVVERATQKVVGVHVVGPDAPEIVQGFAVAVRLGATKQDLDRTIGIHPTAAEELVTMRDKRPDPVAIEDKT
ncbi:MAG: glutathione-disulfide reductase [Deltaproteobacteria bacterium]|nr:glutathione-disulfide reductase [Deltaproteobacteria bacterium]